METKLDKKAMKARIDVRNLPLRNGNQTEIAKIPDIEVVRNLPLRNGN